MDVVVLDQKLRNLRAALVRMDELIKDGNKDAAIRRLEDARLELKLMAHDLEVTELRLKK